MTRNKLKFAPVVLGITVLVAAAAVSTTLALRSHDADADADAEEVAGAVTSESLPTAADLGVEPQASLGIPEPLFIDGEPVTPLDSQVDAQDLPDGTVSISNPNVEPIPMPAPNPAPPPGIAVGEPHPDIPEPRLATPDSVGDQARSGSTGTAITEFTVSGSAPYAPPAPAPDPEEMHVAPDPMPESDAPDS
jgi:hypothetical protein